MGMGWNGNYFSGINGNGSKEFRSPGIGVGMKSWEWEGMVCQKLFPHTSSVKGYRKNGSENKACGLIPIYHSSTCAKNKW